MINKHKHKKTIRRKKSRKKYSRRRSSRRKSIRTKYKKKLFGGATEAAVTTRPISYFDQLFINVLIRACKELFIIEYSIDIRKSKTTKSGQAEEITQFRKFKSIIIQLLHSLLLYHGQNRDMGLIDGDDNLVLEYLMFHSNYYKFTPKEIGTDIRRQAAR